MQSLHSLELTEMHSKKPRYINSKNPNDVGHGGGIDLAQITKEDIILTLQTGGGDVLVAIGEVDDGGDEPDVRVGGVRVLEVLALLCFRDRLPC